MEAGRLAPGPSSAVFKGLVVVENGRMPWEHHSTLNCSLRGRLVGEMRHADSQIAALAGESDQPELVHDCRCDDAAEVCRMG